jgi:cytoskeleton protein RodZ
MEKGLTVGQYLQKNREEGKIPLKSISEITRIPLVNLQALERDEFHLLPGDAYARGFLRSYAKFIHLDPDKVVVAYYEQMESKKNQIQEKEPVAHRSLLKQSLNLFFNVTAKFMGTSLAFPIGK